MVALESEDAVHVSVEMSKLQLLSKKISFPNVSGDIRMHAAVRGVSGELNVLF